MNYSLLLNKDEYLYQFSDAMYKRYMSEQYGVELNCNVDEQKSSIRAELFTWLKNEDVGALTELSIRFLAWLPIDYRGIRTYRIGGFSPAVTQYSGAHLLQMLNPYTNVNIVDININGCITRVNVNPTITPGIKLAHTHIQNSPATVWVITHNLNFIPNAFIVDFNNVQIEGNLLPLDDNTLQITFNSAVTGTAYLS